jgi:hypothetical protein
LIVSFFASWLALPTSSVAHSNSSSSRASSVAVTSSWAKVAAIVAASRSRATRRASRDTPGSSTSRSRNHPIASKKMAFGPSPVTRARLPTYPESSASTCVKSFSPSAFWIFPACSRWVGSRCAYFFTHDGSAISS